MLGINFKAKEDKNSILGTTHGITAGVSNQHQIIISDTQRIQGISEDDSNDCKLLTLLPLLSDCTIINMFENVF